ncbi:hypothetical protein BASA50_005102 [Batrachochytrium salamandrivorans]|uniref:WD repeat-containing protein 19 n=1 Tax=Batrachochytrium salamandrivorans TaxID=1357716 RepID=A0ABQ8FDG8_9FUNG|nr:hypothetical protein BASA50_005102 [Batrachochytrium salamandrivorans]
MKHIFSSRSSESGPILFEWQCSTSKYLASTDASALVIRITDRNGAHIDSIQLDSECIDMKWAKNGDFLAAIQNKGMPLVLWDARGTKTVTLNDTGMKSMGILACSNDGEMIAVTTSKGSLFLLECRSGKKVPVIGKHTKTITGLSWSPLGDLACISADKSFSISNREGDTTFHMGLKGEPNHLQWEEINLKNMPIKHVLSMTINNNSIFIFDPSIPSKPIELPFAAKYGSIVRYRWLKNNQILVGFNTGYLVVVSTDPEQLGKELFQSKNYKDFFGDVAVSPILNVVATCGDNVIKIHDLSNLQDVTSLITLETERGLMNKLQFSDDGQYLTVSTKDGSLYTYLSKLPALGHIWFNRVAYLSSLSDVTVTDYSTTPPTTVTCEIGAEPSCISLGPKHLAVGLGSKVKYYNITPASQRQADGTKAEISYVSSSTPIAPAQLGLSFTNIIWEKEYIAPVANTVLMNESYSAVFLTNGQLHLHPLEADFFSKNGSSTDRQAPQTLVFPEERYAYGKTGEAITITCAAITNEFLVYATSSGMLVHYDLDEILLVNEHQHLTGIKAIYPRPGIGPKLIFVDSDNKAFIMSPLSETPFEIPGYSVETQGVLWEATPYPGRNIFVTWDKTSITTYIYLQETVKGPQCRGLNSSITHLPFGLKPVLLINGVLVCQTPVGKLETLALATHEDLSIGDFLHKYPSENEQGRTLCLMYLIGKLQSIWQLYPTITSRQVWTMLAEAALHSLDISTAKRVYCQMIGNAGMVMNLARIGAIEEQSELQGHVAVIFGDFNAAQQFFLISSNPKEALYLRRDLLEWDQALALANRLWPEEVPVIAREYAAQLEIDGSPAEALAMYEKARATVPGVNTDEELQEHNEMCQIGLTRMSFRTGDISRGMSLLASVTDKQVLVDCANILESIKQYAEAAIILERGGFLEHAAELWIKLKNWTKISQIINKINSPKIFKLYAKAKEAEGEHIEAASAYERAKDYDSVVRVLLENFNDIESAAQLVRKTKSREAAKMMTKAYQNIRDFKSTIEFYVLAGMLNEAFEIAKSHNIVEVFADMVHEEASNEMLGEIAVHFKTKDMSLQAGKFFLHASRYTEALRMFLKCPITTNPDVAWSNRASSANNNQNASGINLAIETVGYAKNDSLTHELIDFLMGEVDGIPKDAKYIFKLYMSLGQFKEAARTAIIIAREEQVLGNYRTAHDLLLDNYQQLTLTKAKVPAELDRMLMLLHSYMLVKTLVRIEDHDKGARMLMRVSNNISKFPSHIVPILTSTVVECHRAGLKKNAFEYAAMLMRPEYRSKVDAKFKRKIEQIVRRPEKDEIEPEPTTPCPYCSNPVAETCLDCDECKSRLPYCIATGFHMTLDDWSVCPCCAFPAIASHFKLLVEKTGQCPMCYMEVDHQSISPVSNPESYLGGKNRTIEEGTGETVESDMSDPSRSYEVPEISEKVTNISNIDRLGSGGMTR